MKAEACVIDPAVVAELRTLFKAGATPSRLMRHIIARHGSQHVPQLDQLIRAYFREAFSISMFRASSDLLVMGPEGLRIARMSGNVIHQMVQLRSEWDRSSDQNNADKTWMNSLVATDAAKLVDEAHPQSSSEIAGIWDHLDEATKDYLKRVFGNAQLLAEKVSILSTLVEQLQQQVILLESTSASTEPNAQTPAT